MAMASVSVGSQVVAVAVHDESGHAVDSLHTMRQKILVDGQ